MWVNICIYIIYIYIYENIRYTLQGASGRTYKYYKVTSYYTKRFWFFFPYVLKKTRILRAPWCAWGEHWGLPGSRNGSKERINYSGTWRCSPRITNLIDYYSWGWFPRCHCPSPTVLPSKPLPVPAHWSLPSHGHARSFPPNSVFYLYITCSCLSRAHLQTTHGGSYRYSNWHKQVLIRDSGFFIWLCSCDGSAFFFFFFGLRSFFYFYFF